MKKKCKGIQGDAERERENDGKSPKGPIKKNKIDNQP